MGFGFEFDVWQLFLIGRLSLSIVRLKSQNNFLLLAKTLQISPVRFLQMCGLVLPIEQWLNSIAIVFVLQKRFSSLCKCSTTVLHIASHYHLNYSLHHSAHVTKFSSRFFVDGMCIGSQFLFCRTCFTLMFITIYVFSVTSFFLFFSSVFVEAQRQIKALIIVQEELLN